MRAGVGVVAALVGVSAGCEPELDQRLDVIDGPRVLTVVHEPAEVRPGQSAMHLAVVATPSGPAQPSAQWSFCTTPKPPTEDNVVNAACEQAAGTTALGAGAMIIATMPAEACRRFGPDPPASGVRARDPDITGGYYQPLRVELPDDLAGELAFGLHRISCGLANAPALLAADFRARYPLNLNPPAPTVTDADGAMPTRVAAGATIDLTASWPTEARESYVSYRNGAAALDERRESMRVSWYATSGGFTRDVTGFAEDEDGDASRNAWRAPAVPGTVTLWIVLRDARGGSAVTTLAVAVE